MRLGLLLVLASNTALAQPADEPSIATSDNAPASPIRLEATGELGTFATRRAAARASHHVGPFGIELDGLIASCDGPAAHDEHSATARTERMTDTSRSQVTGRWTERSADELHAPLDADDLSLVAGATWWSTANRIDTDGSWQRIGGRVTVPASATSARLSIERRMRNLGISHELAIGAGIVQLASDDTAARMSVTQRALHGQHRFLDAYLHDTIRVIETLDISGGFVIEDWRWLSYHQALGPPEEEMADAQPEIEELHVHPRVSAVYRLDDHLAVRARGYRQLRPPTPSELYRTTQQGNVLVIANELLRPETVTAGELGPQLVVGKIEAHTVMFWDEITSPISAVAADDGSMLRANLGHARTTGLEASASWQAASALHATLAYRFAHTALALVPRNEASAGVTYAPKRATLTTVVHYVDRDRIATPAHAIVDAFATRHLRDGVAGYLSIDNALDRRTTLGDPRTIVVGLRLDSANF